MYHHRHIKIEKKIHGCDKSIWIPFGFACNASRVERMGTVQHSHSHSRKDYLSKHNLHVWLCRKRVRKRINPKQKTPNAIIIIIYSESENRNSPKWLLFPSTFDICVDCTIILAIRKVYLLFAVLQMIPITTQHYVRPQEINYQRNGRERRFVHTWNTQNGESERNGNGVSVWHQ